MRLSSHFRIALRISLSVCSLALVAPRQLRAQESLCTPGADVEVKIDGRWWPGHVEAAPRNGECPVTHRAYFGTQNTSNVTFDKLRPVGTDPANTGPRKADPLCVPGADVEIVLGGQVVKAKVMEPHPTDGTCLVEHRAYAGVRNSQWMAPGSLHMPGSVVLPTRAPAALPVPITKDVPVAKPAPAPVPIGKRLPAPLPAAPAGARGEVASGIYMLVDGMGNLRYRTFLPGGFVYSGVPTGGTDVFTVADARADARHLGAYALNGGTLTINWPDKPAPEVKTYATRGADIMLDGYRYQAIHAYPAGHVLDGRYTTRVYNSMGVAGGGVMSWGGASTVTFRADGTFDAARGGMASTSAGNGAAGSGESKSHGRYVIRGNTITFTFDDGSVQRALIHPWNGEERALRPGSFNLNGHTYTKA